MMKGLMKEFLSRGHKLLNELWKRQVSRPYLAQENSFKGKLEGKLKPEITVETENGRNSFYEPTRISSVYDSLSWRLRRVKEYWKDIVEGDIVLDRAYKEVRAIIDS